MHTISKWFLLAAALLLMAPRAWAQDEVQTGYKEGLSVATKDGKFGLKLNTRLQFLTTVQDLEMALDERETSTSFAVRRARIVWGGNAFYPWLKYELQLTLEGTGVSLRDYALDFGKYAAFQPRLGQYKLPFTREFLTSSSNLQFVDRSIASEEFALGRDIGVAVRGHLGEDLLEYGAGAFNGSGKNRVNQDRALIYVGRVTVTSGGKYAYSQGALENPERPLLAFGAGLAFLPNFKPGLEGVDDRKHLAEVVGATGSDTSDVVQVTADGALKYRGLSVEGEYDLRSIDPEEPALDTLGSLRSTGLRLQAGYFLQPKRWELAVRYALIDPNTKAGDDGEWEITPAISYYLSGHRLKIQGDFSLIGEQQPGEDLQDRRVRGQVQMVF